MAAAIEAERLATGGSFRDVLNRLVRRGLRNRAPADPTPLPLLPGAPKVDVTDISRVLGSLDDDRLLERGGP